MRKRKVSYSDNNETTNSSDLNFECSDDDDDDYVEEGHGDHRERERNFGHKSQSQINAKRIKPLSNKKSSSTRCIGTFLNIKCLIIAISDPLQKPLILTASNNTCNQ